MYRLLIFHYCLIVITIGSVLVKMKVLTIKIGYFLSLNIATRISS